MDNYGHPPADSQNERRRSTNLVTWFTLTLQRIANGSPISQIEKLMPWNYKT
jgi:hypothetical protein